MIRWCRISAIGIGVFLALALTRGDARPEPVEQPLTLIVRPLIMMTRGSIRVEMRVVPDADNRVLALVWNSDGAGSAGESREALEGADAAVLYVKELRDQIPANYVFEASVYGVAGELRARARAEVHDPREGGGMDKRIVFERPDGIPQIMGTSAEFPDGALPVTAENFRSLWETIPFASLVRVTHRAAYYKTPMTRGLSRLDTFNGAQR